LDFIIKIFYLINYGNLYFIFIIDFNNNYDIYTEIEQQDLNNECGKERKIRTIDEMTIESTILANLLKDK
jgi:hypothetical protein